MAKDTTFKFDYDDPTNLENLLEKYGNRLICFINNFILDFNSSEDLMMDIFVELLLRKPEFCDEKALKSYLFTCAKNKAINYSKKYKKLMLLDEQNIKDTYEVEEQVCDTQAKKILADTIKSLKDKYKEILYLSFIEDLTNEEIAKTMNINEKQVRNLKYRATRKFNKILKEKGYFVDLKEVKNED